MSKYIKKESLYKAEFTKNKREKSVSRMRKNILKKKGLLLHVGRVQNL